MRCSVPFLALSLLIVPACSDADAPQPLAPDAAQLARLGGADHGGAAVRTSLSGGEEVPPRDTPGSGSFVATINPGQGRLCYELSVQDLLAPVVGAHIHSAPAGANGPIVVPLASPTTGFSSGCLDVDRDLLKAIQKDPADYYVNVHTTMFPPGEVRGQLSR
jgi:hypothetical protein